MNIIIETIHGMTQNEINDFCRNAKFYVYGVVQGSFFDEYSTEKIKSDKDAFDIFEGFIGGRVIGEDPNHPEMSAWDNPQDNGIEVPIIPVEAQGIMKDWDGIQCGMRIEYVFCGGSNLWYAQLWSDRRKAQVGHRAYCKDGGSLMTYMVQQRNQIANDHE